MCGGDDRVGKRERRSLLSSSRMRGSLGMYNVLGFFIFILWIPAFAGMTGFGFPRS